MLNLNFRNGMTPALNARNMNAIVESINTMQTQLANPFTFKGSVSAVSNLPPSGNTVNDTYYVTAETCLYTWDGDSWEVSSLSESDYLSIIQQIKNALYDTEDIVFHINDLLGVNLFPAEGYTDGKYITYNTGTEGTNSSFFHTDYIPVVSGGTYFFSGYSGNAHVAFYKPDKTFVPGVLKTANDLIVIPDNVGYMIGSFPLANKTQIGLYSGSETTHTASQGNSYFTELLKWLQVNSLKMAPTFVSSGTYAELLPDLNSANDNTVYFIALSQFSVSNIPLNLPYNIYIEPSILITYSTTAGSQYKTQYFVTKTGMFSRICSTGTWTNWTIIKKPDIHAPRDLQGRTIPLYFINLIESGIPCNIHLDSDIELYSAYKTAKGDNYWDNYQGYSVTGDRNDSGLYLHPHVSFNGNGHTASFNPDVKTVAMMRDFSPFNLGGDNILENVIVDIGTRNCRYAVHDDFAITTEGEIIRYVTMKGTGVSSALLGAGVKPFCSYLIENCLFLDNSGDCDILYHSSTQEVQAASYLVIKNNYCEKDINIKYVGTNQIVTPCIVTGNKVRDITLGPGSGETPYENMRLISWNNELTGT